MLFIKTIQNLDGFFIVQGFKKVCQFTRKFYIQIMDIHGFLRKSEWKF